MALRRPDKTEIMATVQQNEDQPRAHHNKGSAAGIARGRKDGETLISGPSPSGTYMDTLNADHQHQSSVSVLLITCPSGALAVILAGSTDESHLLCASLRNECSADKTLAAERTAHIMRPDDRLGVSYTSDRVFGSGRR